METTKMISPIKAIKKNFKQIVVWTMIGLFLGSLVPTTIFLLK